MNVTQRFPKPSSDAAKVLLKLATRLKRAQGRVARLALRGSRGVGREGRASKRLHESEARDHAWGDAKDAVKSGRSELARLEKAAGALAEKSRIVKDAGAAVEAELRRYAAGHATELWQEIGRDNRAAAARLTAALTAVREAHEDYTQAAARAAELLRLTNPDALRTQRIPDPPHEPTRFATHAPEYAQAMHAPLPGAPGTLPLKPPEPRPRTTVRPSPPSSRWATRPRRAGSGRLSAGPSPRHAPRDDLTARRGRVDPAVARAACARAVA